jgi:hypothetical protein
VDCLSAFSLVDHLGILACVAKVERCGPSLCLALGRILRSIGFLGRSGSRLSRRAVFGTIVDERSDARHVAFSAIVGLALSLRRRLGRALSKLEVEVVLVTGTTTLFSCGVTILLNCSSVGRDAFISLVRSNVRGDALILLMTTSRRTSAWNLLVRARLCELTVRCTTNRRASCLLVGVCYDRGTWSASLRRGKPCGTVLAYISIT